MSAAPAASPTPNHVGQAIVDSLEAHDVTRAFLVPGESFLPVLDGMHGSNIDSVVCRHEGGATYMAEATGKMTGQPGVAMVTRGPGAANAFVAIHTAWQDATPLVLFVGLIPFSDRDRESFQEFDPKAWFGTQTKDVFVLDTPARASEVVAEAFLRAQSGRPGPVVIGLPEDILYEQFPGRIQQPLPIAEGGVTSKDVTKLAEAINAAQRPLIFAGGAHWTPDNAAAIQQFAEDAAIPVIHDWRASDRIAFSSPANAGWLGYGRDDAAAELLEESDLVIELGAVLGDVPTDGYTLRQQPDATNIVINLDASLRGHSGAVTDHIIASPTAFAEVTGELGEQVQESREARQGRFQAAHEAQQVFATVPDEAGWRPKEEGMAHLEAMFATLREQLPADSVYTFGAGNHCIWAQRFLATEQFPSQLSVRNGSMGYSVPAATAAALQFPERTAVTIAGDGEFLMNGQEIATALQEGAPFLGIVVANSEFGTIRDHQEHHFPGRVSGTQLVNPNFADVAVGYGAHGETVTDNSQISDAIARSLDAMRTKRVPAIVHIAVDQKLSLPE